MTETRHILLIHADRAPEIHEIPRDVGLVMYAAADTPKEDSVDYEDVGKIYVPTKRGEYGEALEAAFIRMFVHPEVIAQVKEHGDRRKMDEFWS